MKTNYLFIAILFISKLSSATGIKPVHSHYGFIQNSGQIIDQNNNLNPSCLYLYNGNGLHVQLKQNSFSYEVWQKAEQRVGRERDASNPPALGGVEGLSMTIDTFHIHRVDVTFLKANKTPNIIASDIASDYINYYTTGTPETGVTHVQHFKKVLYQNIYPNIDIEFIVNSPEQNGNPIAIGFKYNFIIHPGGNPKDILIKFDGATNTTLNADGNILIETAYGNIAESIPESYQTDNNNSKQKVAASFYNFNASPFTFGISPSNYDASKLLVIDPWATYYGGIYEDRGFGIASDSIGNLTITGQTYSASSIATSGAYQTSIGGGIYDAFIAEFNVLGVRQWATYFGGNGGDWGYGIAFDGSGNVIITGRTASTSGITTSGAYQTSNGGGSYDAFIAKFNASGARQWATYYGGGGDDYGYGLAADNGGNIMITGYTSSAASIATGGAYDNSYGGSTDAFIAKFNALGARQWATYYGGSSTDYATGIAVDGIANIMVTGYTSSTTGISTSGAFQTSLVGGGTNAFITKFNASGALQWATYYGSNGYNKGNGIATDYSGNLVIIGNTSATSGIATTGAYQISNGGSDDVFIVKFNASGARQWATYYGGFTDDSGNGIATDSNGNIVITGNTTSIYGIATSGAYHTSYGGSTDAFIAKFNATGMLQWSTYYGGSSWDWGYGITVDGNGNIVITGNTLSTTGIATSGSFQTSHGGGTYDAFIASFLPSGGLPVKLLSFDADFLNNKEVLLSWQTASEMNNKHFEVQRSLAPAVGSRASPTEGAEVWSVLGYIQGAGNSNTLRNYQFLDFSVPLIKTNLLFYRLKQTDFDGGYTYSDLVSVRLDESLQDNPIIFPNPANGTFNISTGHFIHELEVLDPTGKSLLKMFDVSGINEIHLDNDLKDGIYFLRIVSDNGTVVKKIEVSR